MGMTDQKKAILCVDDEMIILLSLIQELRGAFGDEYVYEKATDAYRAYEIIDELCLEGIKLILVIADWLMPGIKGDEFLETVRGRHPDVRAVMVTGHADSDVIEHLLSSGCVCDVLEKPWDHERLVAAVRNCGPCRPGAK